MLILSGIKRLSLSMMVDRALEAHSLGGTQPGTGCQADGQLLNLSEPFFLSAEWD